jgi:hypothetical protein
MGNVYLVTFGDKGQFHDFDKSRIRLDNLARESGWFTDTFSFNNNDLGSHLHNMRTAGAGFGWWKAKIVKMVFDKINTDDIVLYLDAGFDLNTHCTEKFEEYVSKCDRGPGFLGFQTSGNVYERQYTKRDVFKFMDCDNPKYTDTLQLASGVFFVKKNKLGIDLMNEWENLCNIEHLINEYPSYHENYPEYIAHRHNQSVFSLLVKRRLPILNDYLLDTIEIGIEVCGKKNDIFPFISKRLDDSLI